MDERVDGGKLAVSIERRVFENQKLFDDEFHKAERPQKPTGCWARFKSRRNSGSYSSKKIVSQLFPIAKWLPNYSWRKQFMGDFMAGCTVAIMHIPQGMGYALLGGVSPIVGIYMAFFPVLLYCILGTSHHISLGTFAVTTLMTGQIVDHYAGHDFNATNETSTNNLAPLDVAVSVCFMVGFWQLVMGIFKLGVLGIVLSDHLVSGFTTGAAVHVLVSQMRNLLGITVPRYSGPFKLVRSTVAILKAIPAANPADVIASAITITIMAVHNDWLKPCYSKHIKYPLPSELIVLVIGTVITRYAYLHENFAIRTLEHIPTGLPIPKSPPFEFLPNILVDSVAVAVVAYAVSLSMAKIFARKRGYSIQNNQELLAQGASNVLGSFFSCMPVAASLSRSMLQESVGGETQLANVVSCVWLLAVLLWIGPFFESLPLSVLASIIVVALKGMLIQYKDLIHALKISPLDAVVWMVALSSVVLVDIDIGLGLGVVASITVLLYRGHCPHHATLGRLPGTEMYADIRSYPCAVEEPGIKIFRWVGAIHFANAETFRQSVDQHLRIPRAPPLIHQLNGKTGIPKADTGDPLLNSNGETSQAAFIAPAPAEFLVVDCSAVSYIDLAGTRYFATLFSDLKRDGISVVLAGCSTHVVEQLDRCGLFDKIPRDNIYPAVIDAVISVQNARCHEDEHSNRDLMGGVPKV